MAPMVALGGMIISESGVPLVILLGEFMLTETVHSLLFVVTAVQFRLMKKTRIVWSVRLKLLSFAFSSRNVSQVCKRTSSLAEGCSAAFSPRSPALFACVHLIRGITGHWCGGAPLPTQVELRCLNSWAAFLAKVLIIQEYLEKTTF